MAEDKKPAGLYEAILAVQREAPRVLKDETAKIPTKAGKEFSYKYADLASVIGAVRPLLVENGLVWSTFPTDEGGKPALRYTLTHASTGESEGDTVTLPVAGVSGPQDLGSAITYFRRYCLVAVLDLIVDDDDGARAQDAARRAAERPKQAAPTAANGEELVTASDIARLRQIAAGLSREQIGLALASCGIPATDRGWAGVPKAKAAVLAEALAGIER